MKEELKNWRGYLMTGASHMIPVVVIGGIFIAVAIALSGVEAGEGANITNPFLAKMNELGGIAFSMMVPVLSGYIAYAIADRPGLAPGLVGGALSNTVGAGFLGGIVAGFVAGYAARWVKNWKVPKSVQPIMPILVIPIIAGGITGIVMFLIGAPFETLMQSMTNGLKTMSTGNMVFLALVMGAMIAFDMGGPVNKVAFFFAVSMISEGIVTVMGPVAVAICIPPLAMGISTLVSPKKYTRVEKESGKSAILMGLIGITEGAIPFAVADPLRVIPSIMIGSSIGAAVAAIGKVGDHAPHGGPIVLPVVENRIMFIVAVIIGIAVTCAILHFWKKDVDEEAATKEGSTSTSDTEIEIEF